jgi:hypothetical protein
VARGTYALTEAGTAALALFAHAVPAELAAAAAG